MAELDSIYPEDTEGITNVDRIYPEDTNVDRIYPEDTKVNRIYPEDTKVMAKLDVICAEDIETEPGELEAWEFDEDQTPKKHLELEKTENYPTTKPKRYKKKKVKALELAGVVFKPVEET